MADQNSVPEQIFQPSSMEQRNILQLSFYNSLILTLFGICFAGVYALYNLLYMFLMPMLWALLVGTVLFPVKKFVGESVKEWIKNLNLTNTPFLIGILILPLKVAQKISDCVYENLFSENGLYAIIIFILFKLAVTFNSLSVISTYILAIYYFLDSLIEIFLDKWVTMALIIYTLSILSIFFVQTQNNSVNKKFIRTLFIPSWTLALIYVADFFGAFRGLLFSLALVLLSLISLGYIKIDVQESESNSDEVDEESQSLTAPTSSAGNISIDQRLDIALTSDAHIRVIICLSTLMFLTRYDAFFLLFLMIALIALSCFIRAGTYLEIDDLLLQSNFFAMFSRTVTKVTNVAVPGLLRKFFQLLFTSDKLFKTQILHRTDLISTISVMLLLALGTIFITLFTVVHLHSEVLHIVKLGTRVVSSNPEWLKHLTNVTGEHLGEVDDYIDMAYHQGRAWMTSNVRSLVDQKDSARADKLEEQVQLLIDNIYRLWEERNVSGIRQKEDLGEPTSGATDLGVVANIFAGANLKEMKAEITNVVKQNIGEIIAILKSIWHVLLANMSVLTTLIFICLGFLFNFGFEVLNLVIELVVFLSVIYYLLANSRTNWVFFDWINRFFSLATNNRDEYRVKVTSAMENAISGVFVLSTKMSIFYLFYTYTVHSLFNLNVVFVPSVLAAIFASIPMLPTYSVSVFGLVELYLIRSDLFSTILFAVLSLAPLFIADPAFYSELKYFLSYIFTTRHWIKLRGSHSYLTGLSVIGGIYWLGLQGAIIGPIILCSVIVLLDFASNFVN